MASKYWLKLFHETIYDPKIMMRSPGARLRWYECLCLAGDYDKDGELPPIEHMLYVFRIPEDQLIKELEELVSPGLLTYRDGVYSITNWHDRQSAMDTNERSMRYRETQQKREYYEPVTKVQQKCNENATNCDADIEVDIDKEVEKKRKDADVDGSNISLIAEFESISKLQAPRDPEDWSISLQAMKNKGITNQIMAQAVSELSEKNYKITGPKSIEQACAIILAKVKRESGPRHNEFSEYVRH